MSDRKYFVNGEIVPAGDARISVRDRGFLYGDAAFETLRAYAGRPFHWETHLERLEYTCHVLRIDHGLTGSELRNAVQETLAANELENAYIRLSITRGVQPGKLTPDRSADPGVVILAHPLTPGGRGSDPVWEEPATVVVSSVRQIPPQSIPAELKTHNYLNGILARLEGSPAEAHEAIRLSTDGYVTEGATSNIFIIRDGALVTPPATDPILPGVTRDIVIRLARDAAIPVTTESLRPEAVQGAEECFLTNTTWEIRPVTNFDGADFPVGAITERLCRAYNEYVDAWIAGNRILEIDRWRRDDD